MGMIYVVATPIGNLSDISQRAIEVLGESDLIAAEDTRNTKKLLNHFSINTRLTSYHKFNEQEKASELVNKVIEEDLKLCIVSDAGTPCISDPGSIIIHLARKYKIPIYPIPGPCAAISALSISGFNVTDFSFYGFLSRQKNKQITELQDIRYKSSISILYESPKRIKNLIKNINIVDSNAEICICNDISKFYEISLVDTPKNILEYLESNNNAEKGEYCLVIKWDNENKCTYNNTDEEILSIEAKIFQLMYQKLSKEDIFKKLSSQGYKRNFIYSKFEDVKNFIKKN